MRNKSEPLRSIILRNRFCVSRTACSRSIDYQSPVQARCSGLEVFLVGRAKARLFLVDQTLRQELGEVLVQRLHA